MSDATDYPAYASFTTLTIDQRWLLQHAEEMAKQVITFSELRDSLIARQTEYWPDPFAAAEWRAPWLDRMA